MAARTRDPASASDPAIVTPSSSNRAAVRDVNVELAQAVPRHRSGAAAGHGIRDRAPGRGAEGHSMRGDAGPGAVGLYVGTPSRDELEGDAVVLKTRPGTGPAAVADRRAIAFSAWVSREAPRAIDLAP